MAFSKPKVYHKLLIQPLIKRFEAEPTAYELALTSCIVLAHFADVLAEERGLSKNDAIREITEVASDFTVVRAISDATKHVELRDRRHGVYLGFAS